MSYFFAFILVCILIWMFFGERIKRWAQQRMMEKVEDAFRARMGMPSAKEERKQRRREEKKERRQQRHEVKKDEPLIPREYAEDVEYVEYKEFSSSTTIETEVDPKDDTRRRATVVVESQVTDVEYVEIKSKK